MKLNQKKCWKDNVNKAAFRCFLSELQGLEWMHHYVIFELKSTQYFNYNIEQNKIFNHKAQVSSSDVLYKM